VLYSIDEKQQWPVRFAFLICFIETESELSFATATWGGLELTFDVLPQMTAPDCRYCFPLSGVMIVSDRFGLNLRDDDM
jgi:hypothetical protein